MKKYFPIIYTLLIIVQVAVITGCNDKITGPSESEQFMPLKSGNKWYYSAYGRSGTPDGNNYSEIWETIGTRNYNGTEFYAVKRTYILSSPAFSDTVYYSASGNSLNQLLKNNSGEYYVSSCAQFNLNVNDKFNYKGNLDYTVTVTAKTEDQISFFYNCVQAADEEYTLTFKKGVGVYDYFSDAWGVGKRMMKAELK